jgi:CBS domain-containing protein
MIREGLPTCGLDERVSAVRARTERAGWDACVVINDHRIVLGLLRQQALQRDGTATAEQVMAPGPGTVRPNLPAEEILDRLRQRDLPSVLVTTSDGELMGMAFREDIEATLAHEAAHEHEPV